MFIFFVKIDNITKIDKIALMFHIFFFFNAVFKVIETPLLQEIYLYIRKYLCENICLKLPLFDARNGASFFQNYSLNFFIALKISLRSKTFNKPLFEPFLT